MIIIPKEINNYFTRVNYTGYFGKLTGKPNKNLLGNYTKKSRVNQKGGTYFTPK